MVRSAAALGSPRRGHLRAPRTPERSYEELGTVTVTGFSATQTAKMHNAVRSKAAALGATAVILTEEGILPGAYGSHQRWATGVAVRYR